MTENVEIKSWRPEKWKNPYPWAGNVACHDAYEEGADAILKGITVKVGFTTDTESPDVPTIVKDISWKEL